MNLEKLTKLTVHILMYEGDNVYDHLVLEGPVDMNKSEQDAYKLMLGDEKASITVSRDLSEKMFGNGGTVFVSVTLTVDQSTKGLEAGYQWGKHFLEKKIWEGRNEYKKQLVEAGILKDK